MKRLLQIFCLLTSTFAAVATMYLWNRSYRAIDVINGNIGSTQYDAELCEGTVKLAFQKFYRLRADLPSHADDSWLQSPAACDSLEEFRTSPSRYSYDRARWPLAPSDVDPNAKIFAGFSTDSAISLARDGPRKYVASRWFQIPYWMPFAIFSVLAVISAVRIITHRHVLRAGHCKSCGYDLRATPDRCPECGTPVILA